jgi:hypothetical protein
MRLYIDDLRKCPEGWTLARTITEAIRLLASGYVTEVSCDHDIIACPKVCCSQRMGEETYQPVAYYLACMPKELRPTIINFHTANPAGAMRMQGILKDAGIDSTYNEGSGTFEWGEDVK